MTNKIITLLIMISLVIPAYSDSNSSPDLRDQQAGADILSVRPIFEPTKKHKPAKFIENFSKAKIWMTLAPDVEFVGPQQESYFVSKDDPNREVLRQKYVKNIFRYIIKKAHLLAADSYYNNGKGVDFNNSKNDNFTYYSFLVLALTVPFHESHLTHARTIPGKNQCFPKVNDLTVNKILYGKSYPSDFIKSSIQNLYRNPYKMYMPSCSTLGETERTTQLLWSYLYDDVGLWQINPYHHPNSIKPGNYLNLYRTIDWGLNYLYNGNGTDNAGGFTFIRDLVSSLDDRKNEKKESRERFKNARGEFKQLCRYNFNSDPYRTNSSLPGKYYNLLRGVWGGQYNSGTTKAIGPNSEGNRVRTKLMANGKVACRASLSKFELTRNEQNKIIRNSKLSMKKISNEKEKKEVAKQHAILLQTAADEIEAKLKSAEGACKISRASITGGYCRFQYPKEFLHPRVRENDTGFEKKLSRVVIENTSIYHNRLPKGSLERKAFDEIIYNFRSIYKKGVQKEKNQALAKLLKETRSYKRETVIMPERFEGAVTHLLLPGSINYYSLPSHIEEKQNNYCGYVSNENVTVGELKLQSKSSKTYKLSDGSEWIQVHFPDYSAMNRKEKRIEYVELADREQLKHVNIRIAPPRASKDPSVRGNVYAKKVCKNIDDKGECKKTFAFRRNKENISSKHKLLGIDEQSGWYKVDLGDGRFGYVSGLEKFTKLVKVNKAHKTEDCERSEYFYIQKDHTLSFEGMFDYDFGTLLVRKGSTKVFSEPLRNRYNKKKILEYLPEGEILISMGMESIDIATASGSATHYFHRIVYPSREGCNIRNFEINKCTAFVFSGDRVSKLEQ